MAFEHFPDPALFEAKRVGLCRINLFLSGISALRDVRYPHTTFRDTLGYRLSHLAGQRVFDAVITHPDQVSEIPDILEAVGLGLPVIAVLHQPISRRDDRNFQEASTILGENGVPYFWAGAFYDCLPDIFRELEKVFREQH